MSWSSTRQPHRVALPGARRARVERPRDAPIHLNTAGSGLLPDAAVEAMTAYLREEAVHGSYEVEARHADTLRSRMYDRIARLVNAAPQDIALFDSATRAWCTVVGNLSFSERDRVWVTPYEYAGNLIALVSARRRYGFRIEVVPLLPNGDLDLDWMARSIGEDVALVSVVHVPSGCGVVNPVEEAGAILRPWRCLYVVDACQSVGQVPVDVQKIGCDVLTAAGRKFLCGPRGTGFAYISPRLSARACLPFYDLHVAEVTSSDSFTVSGSGARIFEYAERDNAALIGLDAALACRPTADATVATEAGLALRAELAATAGIRLVTPGSVQSGIVSFVHDSVPAERIFEELARRHINVWVAEGSHTPIYMARQGIDRAVRASVHHYNTVEEARVFGQALSSILRQS